MAVLSQHASDSSKSNQKREKVLQERTNHLQLPHCIDFQTVYLKFIRGQKKRNKVLFSEVWHGLFKRQIVRCKVLLHPIYLEGRLEPVCLLMHFLFLFWWTYGLSSLRDAASNIFLCISPCIIVFVLHLFIVLVQSGLKFLKLFCHKHISSDERSTYSTEIRRVYFTASVICFASHRGDISSPRLSLLLARESFFIIAGLNIDHSFKCL